LGFVVLVGGVVDRSLGDKRYFLRGGNVTKRNLKKDLRMISEK